MALLRNIYRQFFSSPEAEVRDIDPLGTSDGVAELRAAAKLCEDAAYNLASVVDCDLVSQIIVLSADIERVAGTAELELMRRPLHS